MFPSANAAPSQARTRAAQTSGISIPRTSTGIAQQVKHLYFYVATSMTDSDLELAINKAVESNQLKAFNMSFGECEFFPYIDGSMLRVSHFPTASTAPRE